MASFVIGVIGPGDGSSPDERRAAETVGALIARAGHIVITGGLGGVMESASSGAAGEGGIVVGLLPGDDRRSANAHVTVALPTGLGELRNGLLVRSCDAIIAVGGSWGTLSEIALAVRTGVPVVSLAGWDLPEPGPVSVSTPEEAAATALRLAERAR